MRFAGLHLSGTRTALRRVGVVLAMTTAVGVGAVGGGIAPAGAGGRALASAPSGSGTTVTYTATIHIPAPPSSNFAGANGAGDGWGIGLTPTAVYNIFHHNGSLNVSCHLQSDASPCWGQTLYKTITETSGSITGTAAGDCSTGTPCGFSASGEPGLYVDQASGHLFVYATGYVGSSSTEPTAGVVCIDTTQPASNPDPFCGFTPLSNGGDAPLGSYFSGVTDPLVVNGNWYAFNYVDSSSLPSGTEDKLMCFSLTTLKACPGQPYAVNLGTNTVSGASYPSPAIAAIGNQIVIPIETGGSSSELACFDTTTGKSCTGKWPLTLSFNYPASTFGGPAFPLLNSSGTATGLCLPDGTEECYSLSGSSVATPTNLATVMGSTDGWNGPAVVLGARVYLPNGNLNGEAGGIECFDYATDASCTNYPKLTFGTSSLSINGSPCPCAPVYLYTVNPDPARPTCLWMNSDAGGGTYPLQIANFDAFTGAACGAGAIRVLASSVVVPHPECIPANYTSIQVQKPQRSQYASGTVQFENSDGVPLTGVPTQNLDATGSVNLTPLKLTTKAPLPQFLISLNKPTVPVTTVTVKLTWLGTFSTDCNQGGTSAKGPTTAATTVHDAATNGSWSGTEVAGASAYDTTVIGGKAGSIGPEGTVTYRFFNNGTCSGSPSKSGSVTIADDGTVPSSFSSGALQAGDYSFKASYLGDSDYLASTGSCETFRVASATRPGYRLVGQDGGVFAFRQTFHGSVPPPSPPGLGLHISNAVGMAATGKGVYWVIQSNGGVFAFGGHFYGSLPGRHISVNNIVGGTPTPSGHGYWLVASNGTVYSFGDATNLGSPKGVSDVVAIHSPGTDGYWILTATGRVYSYGDAPALGDCTQKAAGCTGVDDIVGMASPDKGGYWLAAADGGVFTFGDAKYRGSCPLSGQSCHGVTDVVGIAGPDQGGYWLVEADGNVLTFGDAKFFGDCAVSTWGCLNLARPLIGITSGLAS